ncbi:unnamed protein product [Owenia fusiformis]|uniref:Ig-like domain-containing protein n=1 Tax=Owenia fusiformis TaxID=6347 RepID=A0A8S4NK78_OWEFU|nr:unnamed protein product [Owenia fusiformis]
MDNRDYGSTVGNSTKIQQGNEDSSMIKRNQIVPSSTKPHLTEESMFCGGIIKPVVSVVAVLVITLTGVGLCLYFTGIFRGNIRQDTSKNNYTTTTVGVPIIPDVSTTVEQNNKMTTEDTLATVEQNARMTTADALATVELNARMTTADTFATVEQIDKMTTTEPLTTFEQNVRMTTADAFATFEQDARMTTTDTLATVEQNARMTTADTLATVEQNARVTTADALATVEQNNKMTTTEPLTTVEQNARMTTVDTLTTVEQNARMTTTDTLTTVEQNARMTTADALATVEQNARMTTTDTLTTVEQNARMTTTDAVETVTQNARMTTADTLATVEHNARMTTADTLETVEQNEKMTTKEPLINEDDTFIVTYGEWTKWSLWSSCSVTCDRGSQTRTRLCRKKSPEDIDCDGEDAITRICDNGMCPDCNKTCPSNKLLNGNCTACICPSNIRHIQVFNTKMVPIDGVTVANLETQYEILGTTADSNGNTIDYLCESDLLIFKKLKYVDVTLSVGGVSSDPIVVTMETTETIEIVSHPQDAVALTGDSVNFTCRGIGKPAPDVYQWFKNGKLLTINPSSNDIRLTLTGVNDSDKGLYYCKASSDYSSAISNIASLDVKDDGERFCDTSPLSHLKTLPKDCPQTSENPLLYEVGRCRRNECIQRPKSNTESEYCCGPIRQTTRSIACVDYSIDIVVTLECGCIICNQANITGNMITSVRKITFSGFAHDIVDKNFPLRFGKVFLFDEEVATASFNEIPSSETTTLSLANSTSGSSFADVIIPGESFYKANGEKYNGPVQTAINFLDPRNNEDLSAMVGDLTFTNDDGDIGSLQTFGMFHLAFSDTAGNDLNIKGEVGMAISADVIGAGLQNATNVKLWSFNPSSARWEYEGNLRRVSNRKKRSQAQDTTDFFVGDAVITDRYWFNFDNNQLNYCFIKVKTYSDSSSASPLPWDSSLEPTVISLDQTSRQAGSAGRIVTGSMSKDYFTGVESNKDCILTVCGDNDFHGYLFMDTPEGSLSASPNLGGSSSAVPSVNITLDQLKSTSRGKVIETNLGNPFGIREDTTIDQTTCIEFKGSGDIVTQSGIASDQTIVEVLVEGTDCTVESVASSLQQYQINTTYNNASIVSFKPPSASLISGIDFGIYVDDNNDVQTAKTTAKARCLCADFQQGQTCNTPEPTVGVAVTITCKTGDDYG